MCPSIPFVLSGHHICQISGATSSTYKRKGICFPWPCAISLLKPIILLNTEYETSLDVTGLQEGVSAKEVSL